MMDYYGEMAPPCVKERCQHAFQSVPQYHYLSACHLIVAKAVNEVKPGSYAGYFVFARSEIQLRVIHNCKTHIAARNWALLLRCKRLAHGLRMRVCESYAPGGLMYTVVKQKTLVGQ